jgi:predicted permease
MLNDLRYTFRMLLKSPGFTVVAVLSLALGIGAGTAIFSLVNAILLRSLPVPNPQELRLIHWSGDDVRISYQGSGGGDLSHHFAGESVSFPVFKSLRDQCAEQADVFGFCYLRLTARARGEAISAQGLMVSGNFFSGLDVHPLIGRLLGIDDERADALPSVVISFPWWEHQFDRDLDVLGKTVRLNGLNFTVVGVLPGELPRLLPGVETDFYVPTSAKPQLMPDDSNALPNSWIMPLMARLKPGVNDAQFQAVLNVAFAHDARDVMKNPAASLTDGRAGPDGGARSATRVPLMMLLGLVGVVVLVACANLAGLSLARGAARQHEFAVRSAIGAGRWRLVRQSLTESVLISACGGGVGVLLAFWGKTALFRMLAGSAVEELQYDTSFDLTVLGFALIMAVFTTLLSGILPALQAARVNPLAGLKERAAHIAPRLGVGRVLIAGQIALSLLLVVAAGLYARTLINLVQINPGFDTQNILLFRLNPFDEGYSAPRTALFMDRATQSLASLPGVKSVALTEMPLLGGGLRSFGFQIPGYAAEDVNIAIVSDGLFNTLGIPMLLGRDLRPSDTEIAQRVIVVNQAFVTKYFPGRDPIGLSVKETGTGADWQIVGVCGDAQYVNLKSAAQPTVHFSYRQRPLRWGAVFAVRTTLPSLAAVPGVSRAVAAIDPNVPLTEIQTQDQVRDASIEEEHFFAALCGSLAMLALVLSCIGLFGLMAYNVTRRTSEIGIRMALGASRWQIAAPVLREALVLAGMGTVIGIPFTFASTWLIRSTLFGVGPADATTFCGAAMLFLLVAVMAAWIPARRAGNVDPMVALRCE